MAHGSSSGMRADPCIIGLVITTRTRAVTQVLLAAALFGSTGVAVELAATAAGPATLGAARLLIGGVALTWRTQRSDLADAEPPLPADVRRRSDTAVAVAAVVAYQLLAFAAVARSGAAVAAVVSIGSGPLWAGVLDLWGGGRPTLRWWLTVSLAVAGAWALVGAGSASVDGLGVACAVGAGCGWTVFTRRSAAMVSRGCRAGEVAAAVFLRAGAVLSPVLVFQVGRLLDVRFLAVAMYLGVVTVAVAYTGYIRALESLRARDVVSLTLAEPVVAAVLSTALAAARA